MKESAPMSGPIDPAARPPVRTPRRLERKTAWMETAEVTQILRLWRQGDEHAFERLLPLVYDELRRVAASYLRRERAGHTLQTTALVHEVYLRLARVEDLDAKDRSHFLTVAARAMRRILVDHARSQKSEKRVGAHRRRPLEEAAYMESSPPSEVLGVHRALTELAASHPRQAQLVELRYFGGFSESEAADILGVSRATLTRDWRFAKVWLRRQLDRDP